MSWCVVSAAALVTLLLSGFYSGSETGLYCLNRLRVHLGTQQGDARARYLARLLEDEQATLSTALLGTNLMNYLLTAVATHALVQLLGFTTREAEAYTVLLVTPVVFVFGEVVPKNLYQAHADTLMARSGALLWLSRRVFQTVGATGFLKRLASGILRLLGESSGVREAFGPKRRVIRLLREALVHERHGADRSEWVDRVMRLGNTPLHQIMVPFNRVVGVPAGADRRQLVGTARRSGHARLPVYERSPRHVIGVVNVDALLRDDAWGTVGERTAPAVRISPHDTALTALRTMRRQGHPLAVVADHSGRMLGIVTLADLLEEVIGEGQTR
ncbi:MAG TPA: CNNM domain-containing protein [Phycisphaerae bacterium]|nr:CNNM domain-containing protein [Phycisphaerae bacterium]HNU44119.1 CNNM domain-containing protein [Phycisphaerae bacterium]